MDWDGAVISIISPNCKCIFSFLEGVAISYIYSRNFYNKRIKNDKKPVKEKSVNLLNTRRKMYRLSHIHENISHIFKDPHSEEAIKINRKSKINS